MGAGTGRCHWLGTATSACPERVRDTVGFCLSIRWDVDAREAPVYDDQGNAISPAPTLSAHTPGSSVAACGVAARGASVGRADGRGANVPRASPAPATPPSWSSRPPQAPGAGRGRITRDKRGQTIDAGGAYRARLARAMGTEDRAGGQHLIPSVGRRRCCGARRITTTVPSPIGVEWCVIYKTAS